MKNVIDRMLPLVTMYIRIADGQCRHVPRYDCIGFASGIYYSKFQETVLNFARQYLPNGKDVFFVYTCGSMRKDYTRDISEIVTSKGARILGEYGCRGFDTFGPFRLIGGVAKGHPNADELQRAKAFYLSLCQEQ